jgi:hypothetical protein
MRWEHTDSPARIICPRTSYKVELPQGSKIDTLVRVDSHIINLPKIPQNITPTNVNEKIRLYLLFS